MALVSDSKGSLRNLTKEIELEPFIKADSPTCLDSFEIESLGLVDLQSLVFEIISMLETFSKDGFPQCRSNLKLLLERATAKFHFLYLTTNDEFSASLITQNLRMINSFKQKYHAEMNRVTQEES